MTRRKDKPVELSSPLDLGLSSLMGKAESDPSPAAGTQSVPKSSAPAASEDDASELEKLARAGDWEKLAALSERQLPPKLESDERLELLEVRLWWIRSQERLALVPLSILAAPLEELASSFERCVKQTNPDYSNARRHRLTEELGRLLGTLSNALKGQNDRPGAARLSALRASLLAERAEEPAAGVSSTLPQPNSASVFQGDVEADSVGGLREEKVAAGKSSVAQPIDNKSTLRLSLLAALCVLLAWLIWSQLGAQWLSQWLLSPQSPSSGSLAALPDGIPGAELKSDALIPIAKVNQLDAILEDIKNEKPIEIKQRAQAQSSADQVPPPMVSQPSIGSASVSAAKLEVVDTSGPREPRDFPRFREQADSRRGRDADRTASGPSDRRPSLADRPGFETFPRARLYKTLTETDVMPSATIRARPLDTLPAGVEILVEGREGFWLKIRSQKGNLGYILAQDAARED